MFGGISIEGSIIVERQDANVQAYANSDVTAKKLLGGAIEPPPWASPLIKTLEVCTGLPGTRKWIPDPPESPSDPGSPYAFGGLASPSGSPGPAQLKKKKKDPFPPLSWGSSKGNGSYFNSQAEDPSGLYSTNSRSPVTAGRSTGGFDNMDWKPNDSTSKFETHFQSDFSTQNQGRGQGHNRMSMSMSQPPTTDLFDPFDSAPSSHARSMSMASPRSLSSNSNRYSTFDPSDPYKPFSTSTNNGVSPSRSNSINHSPTRIKPELSRPLQPNEGVARAIGLYEFKAVESGDLSFSKGDIITVTKKSDSTDDWCAHSWAATTSANTDHYLRWTGKLDGRQGIFPANFVEVI